MAWLTGWKYRKSHVINPASEAGTGYQVKIIVHYGSGIDTAGDVYLNSGCRTDFGDIRFSDNDETTLLPYWIEQKINSNNAIIWVRITDDLNTSAVTIYIYFGKADAISASSIGNTGIIGQDFDEQGDSEAPTNWILETQQGGEIRTVSDPYVSPSRSLMFRDSSRQAYVQAYRPFSNQTRFKSEIMVRSNQNGTTFTLLFEDAARLAGPVIEFWNNGWITYILPSGNHSNIQKYYPNIWYRLLLIIDCSTDTFDIYIDGVLKGSSLPFYNVLTDITNLTVWTGTQSRMDSFIDDLILFKHISPEPSHGGWGYRQTSIETIESFGMQDFFIKKHVLRIFKTLIEIFDLEDSQSRIKTLQRSLAESLVFLDSRISSKSLMRTFVELLGVSCFLARQTPIIRTVIEKLGTTDVWSRTKIIVRTRTEELDLADSRSRIKELQRIIIEGLGGKDIQSRIKDLQRVCSELLASEDFIHIPLKVQIAVLELLGQLDIILEEILIPKAILPSKVGKKWRIVQRIPTLGNPYEEFEIPVPIQGFPFTQLVEEIPLIGKPVAQFALRLSVRGKKGFKVLKELLDG